MFKNEKGFSLIELMIVVAIIGILAAIAIPNFQQYQAKSRQSEAKALLSGLFTAEKAFHAEWLEYSTDFGEIGFEPNGNLRYNVGFTADEGRTIANYTGRSATSDYATNEHCNASADCDESGVDTNCGSSTLGVGTNVNATVFAAEACGNIDSDTNLDNW